ncbi:MAG TPA: glycerophosphodiester phosphodiesterase family protein [Flavisolibacter sp.]|nr:glycerophosphodiester phosphodiesterase family protein [Flavisolibacter sp.]
MNKYLILSATICLLSDCSPIVKTGGHKGFAKNPVVAHRGAFKKNGLPENSIAALKEAIRLGCTGSEFDVRMTADDSLIINHDPHYSGKEIEKTVYSELSSVKLSNGEPLPTLRSYLLAGMENNTGTRLVLEIKPSGMGKERARLIVDKVVKMVNELGARSMTVYISFDYDMLKRIAEISPGSPSQYLNGDRAPEQLKADGIGGADYHISVYRLHPEWIEAAKKLGIILNAWTVNEAEGMRWLLGKNFDYITTNEPEMLLSIWERR